jgi:hypothetical protein
MITLSFSREIEQRIVEIAWDGRDPKTAVSAAKKLLAERLKEA